jgi:hypothetical protein
MVLILPREAASVGQKNDVAARNSLFVQGDGSAAVPVNTAAIGGRSMIMVDL